MEPSNDHRLLLAAVEVIKEARKIIAETRRPDAGAVCNALTFPILESKISAFDAIAIDCAVEGWKKGN